MQEPNSIVQEIYKDEIVFTEEERTFIENRFEKVTFKKGEIILVPEIEMNYQYYVSTGCLRTYLIEKSGKEHTIQFAIKDWWISDYIGYFLEGKSVLYIECLEDAMMYKIQRDDIEEIYVNIPKTERFTRKKLERSYATLQKRILRNLSQSAKERYLSFTKEYPNIEQYVKNYHIASYLGITTESLSRIRKDIAQN
ncbi:hypothetical protein IMCC3317_00590 [Kordia antarctica]|uniref:Cyclic nucleotide-binding domain-containing protein n=1 Tax=Kordia antarctica TaxID=1218801 RepID=A0A7L4ZER3_9FLAO|nr:Crp/Fnr family transcriptional regulator [Kordia antarctica]QHI34716.1 hypothetical protein IMCC3317_00590 [Kordia antarctica]